MEPLRLRRTGDRLGWSAGGNLLVHDADGDGWGSAALVRATLGPAQPPRSSARTRSHCVGISWVLIASRLTGASSTSVCSTSSLWRAVLTGPVIEPTWRRQGKYRKHVFALAGLYFHLAVGKVIPAIYRDQAADAVPGGQVILGPANQITLFKWAHDEVRRARGVIL